MIIARIIRALQLGVALEARLVSGVAPWQLVPGGFRLPAPRKPRAGQAARGRVGGLETGLDRMPTAKEIAAAVRCRSVGVVIAELIRDFGILPCHPQWRELSEAVLFNGGNLAALYQHIGKRGMVATGNPAFLPHPLPETLPGGQEALPGAAALPAGWMPPHVALPAGWRAAWLPSPTASGAGPP